MQLHRDRKKFEEAGVRLAVIGQGQPEHARHFREQLKVDLPIYASGDREVRLGDLWEDQPAVLVFLRHYG